MPSFANLRLASKIMLLVALLGVIALVISGYSMHNLRGVDRGYRSLIEQQARSALSLGDASLLLSESSRLVYVVLTEQEEQQMLAIDHEMTHLQQRFEASLERIRPLIPEHAEALDKLAAQSPPLFQYAHAIIGSAARWRGDRALSIIHEQFEPALHQLQDDMDALRNTAVTNFGVQSVELSRTTHQTIVTSTFAVGGGLLLVLLLSAYLSITRISRPITALTRVMERLTDRAYDVVIPGTGRRDEVGVMAQALQVFKDNMQRADQLSVEVARSEQARLLSEQIAAEKTAFLALMSHEIRTPLNAMLGMAQLALKSELSLPQRNRIETILRSGKHLLSIINDILDLSKIDSGNLVLEHTDFELAQVLADVLDMLADQAMKKKLPIRVELAEEAPRMLRGDPTRISQILLNYLANAIKFTEQGEIVLTVEVHAEDERHWRLSCQVSDSGIGMNEQQLGNLFQAFRQADASITRRFGGTGLGLAICRRLAESMGGATGASSNPGVGSMFWFTARLEHSRLPAPAHDKDTPPLAAALALPPEHNTHALRGRRILLVDDNALNRIVASGLLESAGLLVDSVSDGQAALDTLHSAADAHYAAVLMDIQMPVLDGLSSTRLLRREARFADLPIIALTANASPEDLSAYSQVGMNAYLAKPLDERMLWETLLRCIPPVEVPRPPAGLTHAAPAFDPTPLHELQRRLSTTRFAALLTMFEDDCRARLQRIAEASAKGELDTLRRMAHDLISTAGNFGLAALSTLGVELRNHALAGDLTKVHATVVRIGQAAEPSLQAMRQNFSASATATSNDQ
jgi:signal transduction histidine kinase/response regulator RpfG family c-di-GMP phosphodiesterase